MFARLTALNSYDRLSQPEVESATIISEDSGYVPTITNVVMQIHT